MTIYLYLFGYLHVLISPSRDLLTYLESSRTFWGQGKGFDETEKHDGRVKGLDETEKCDGRVKGLSP